MMGWALAGLAAAGAAPFVAERLRPLPGRAEIERASGRFADLPSGRTHFYRAGPAEGPLCVLVHGLTTPGLVWEALAPRLASAGFRVLSYDLFGRGLSARAPGRQDRAFFLRQLHELLEHEGERGPLALVGYSMGGQIVAAFAAEDPERVTHLAMIAPAGLGHDAGRLGNFVRAVPGLGDWLMLGFGGHSLRRDFEALRGQQSEVPGIIDRQIAETRRRGFLPAVLSSKRNILSHSSAADHRRIAEAGIPLLTFWAEDDAVIPPDARAGLSALNPAARQIVIGGADHGLTHTHAGQIAEDLVPFLRA